VTYCVLEEIYSRVCFYNKCVILFNGILYRLGLAVVWTIY